MNNKLIFISGPYSANTKLATEFNIGVARDAAIWLAEHKIFYFCPHLNSMFFEQWLDTPVSFYYVMDEEILSRCDALLLLPGWENSKGATSEFNFATRANKPLFYYPHQQELILEWHREERA